MAFNFPWSNLHELNLDWILSIVKRFSELVPPMETAVEDIQALQGDVAQAVEDATSAVSAANQAAETAAEALEVAEQAAQETIADGAVVTSKIANGAVTTAKLEDGAVTSSKIANDSVTLAKIAPELKGYFKKYNIFHVNYDGTADFTTISAAVSKASENDVIVVHPGVYNESVKAFNKKIHIVGIDRDTCILQYSGLDYYNPPLEMAKGSLTNITIKCLNSGTVGSSKAYCVHIDNNNSANETLKFTDVHFINPVHQGVGIGLRPHFLLTFEGCIFETEEMAALYCHDWETSDTSADKTEQKIVCTNCIFINNSNSQATILLQSQELQTDCATCTFIGCSIVNKNNSGTTLSMTLWKGRSLTNNSFLGSSDWVLDTSSALNTNSNLNETPYPVRGKDLKIYNNIRYRTFSRDDPISLPLARYQGAFIIGNLQGVGFTILSIYHQYGTSGDVLVIKNVVSGADFSSSYFTFTVTTNTIEVTTTTTSASIILYLSPTSAY